MKDSLKGGSFSIVSTMRELPAIVAAFVAHHLHMDVDEIFIFLDAPDSEVQAFLANVARCRVTVCDEAYWLSVGLSRRPKSLVKRQLLNAEQARKWTDSEWLIHIDSDEFLLESGPLRAEFAAMPTSVDLVRIRNLERFIPQSSAPSHIFEGKFRDQIANGSDNLQRIYGSAAKFLNKGLCGYVRGKTATRVDSAIPMLLHALTHEDNLLVDVRVSASVSLLHFDGFTAKHWVAKLLRRIDDGQLKGSKAREEQLSFMKKADGLAQRMSLFDKVMVLDERIEVELAKLGLLLGLKFDPLPAMQSLFPKMLFDLSRETFDRQLVAAKPEWYQA